MESPLRLLSSIVSHLEDNGTVGVNVDDTEDCKSSRHPEEGGGVMAIIQISPSASI